MAAVCRVLRCAAPADAANGALHRTRAGGGKDVPRSPAPARRAGALPRMRDQGRAGNDMATVLRRHADLQPRLSAAYLRDRTRTGTVAMEPATSGRCNARARLQYRSLV